MTDGFPITLVSNTPDETQRLATALAPLFFTGDTILLIGDIGAGKSHFARSVIQARLAVTGKSEDIPSPTYTLVQTYTDGICDIWHADLYRLSNSDEIIELGLTEAFQNSICLVEWPSRLDDLCPRNALSVFMEAGDGDDVRIIRFEAAREQWDKILPILRPLEINDAR